MSARTLEEWAKEVLGWAESFGSTWEFLGDDNWDADKLHEEGKAILARAGAEKAEEMVKELRWWRELLACRLCQHAPKPGTQTLGMRFRCDQCSQALAQSQWISVEERLPEIDGQVAWVALPDGRVRSTDWNDFLGAFTNYPRATHWMPLERPEPPQNAPGGPKSE